MICMSLPQVVGRNEETTHAPFTLRTIESSRADERLIGPNSGASASSSTHAGLKKETGRQRAVYARASVAQEKRPEWTALSSTILETWERPPIASPLPGGFLATLARPNCL